MPTLAPSLRGDDEVDAIPPALLNGVGVAGLFSLLFWMIASGRLVTRREHENRIADKDAVIAASEQNHERRIADKDAKIVMWRAVGETSQAQTAEMLEHSRLSVQLLQAIERRAQEQQERARGREA